LLDAGEVVSHPFVVGEIACGSIAPRAVMLDMLKQLPAVPRASDDEALELIERHHLMARGIGYIDIHLLASTLLAGGTRLWTIDTRLGWAASRLFVAYNP
jgi:hypothetical protein